MGHKRSNVCFRHTRNIAFIHVFDNVILTKYFFKDKNRWQTKKVSIFYYFL